MGGQLCSDCTTCISSELCVTFQIFYLDHWVAMFKVHLCKPIQTLLTQNSKTIGKILLPRSVWNSHTQLLSGKPGSLKNTLTNLRERVSIRFAFLYVDSPPSCYYRISINGTMVQLGYWIVERLVDRSTEFYPRGGMSQLVSFPYFDGRQNWQFVSTSSNEVWASWNPPASQSFSTTMPFRVYRLQIRCLLEGKLTQSMIMNFLKVSSHFHSDAPPTSNFMYEYIPFPLILTNWMNRHQIISIVHRSGLPSWQSSRTSIPILVLW